MKPVDCQKTGEPVLSSPVMSADISRSYGLPCLIEVVVDQQGDIGNRDLAVEVNIRVAQEYIVEVAAQDGVNQQSNVGDIDNSISIHVAAQSGNTFFLNIELHVVKIQRQVIGSTRDAECLSVFIGQRQGPSSLLVAIPEVTIAHSTEAERADVSPAAVVVVLGQLSGETEIVEFGREGNGSGVNIM